MYILYVYIISVITNINQIFSTFSLYLNLFFPLFYNIFTLKGIQKDISRVLQCIFFIFIAKIK